MHSDDLRFARELAELGGRIAMGHFRHDPETKKKDDGTWVTEADWAVEAQIRLRLARTFPEHNVLGEEEGLTAAGGGAPKEGAPTWVIDPIDGTNNYIAGIPVWATLVGLCVEDRPVLGVAHAPALSETYEAAVGLGARMNGVPISVDLVDDIESATVLYASYSSFVDAGISESFAALAARSYRTRGFGDFWGHMLVARGAAHAMLEPQLRTWDFVPLQVIVEEAGGRQSTFDGTALSDHGSVLTTNGVLHDEMLDVLRGS
ncbi:MAG TPA: inositol monophosphatase family protein [Actinomycetota bacterium]